MRGIFRQLYNGFVLRDFLGYVIPGSFVLFCFIHLLDNFFDVNAYTFAANLVRSSSMAGLYMICISYALGHFLSGIFFHTPIFRPLFTYFPEDLMRDYPNLERADAWAEHRGNYIAASSRGGRPFKSYIERHAALLHFTGLLSAACLFAATYLIIYSVVKQTAVYLPFVLPLAIVFPGIYIHSRRLSLERYRLERQAISKRNSPTKSRKRVNRKTATNTPARAAQTND